MLIGQLKEVAKISTTEMIVEKIVYHKDKGFWITADAHFVAKTEAHIKIGIDLNKLDPIEDVIIRGTTITLHLPDPEITSFSYPAEKFEVVESISNARTAFLNKAQLREIDDYFQQAETEIWETIPQTGIFETARNQTRTVMARILHNLGYTLVQIDFKTTTNSAEL